MGDEKRRPGRPRMISATLKVGNSTSQMLAECVRTKSWSRFDAIAAAFVRISLRLDEDSPMPKGADPCILAVIRNEVELMGTYASISTANLRNSGLLNPKETAPESSGNSGEYAPESPRNSDKNARATEELRIGEKSPSPLPANLQAEEEAFEDLWAVYPRKQAKNDARRAFHRVLVEDGVAPATIFYAVMEQAKSAAWKEDGGKFVPSLAKWLDGGRWNDVLSAPAEKNLAAPPAQDPFACPTPLPPEERWKKPKPEEIQEESKT